MRPTRREGLVEEIGGLRIARRRPPAWLLVVIVAVLGWGLYYMITFSVTETGTFEAPAALLRATLRLAGP